MFLIYDLIFMLYALVYLPYLLLTRRGYAGFEMRFGFFPSQVKKQIKQKANIWVHAVSVGEVMAVDGFIERLNKRYPAYQLILTVTTKTGYKLACQRLKDKALVIPAPIDFSFVTKQFVSVISPKMYIAVETEIWPNLYRQLSRKGIPLAVINGRISDGSFGRYKTISFLLKGILDQVSIWCMQSQRDADKIIDLGAASSKVVVTGNIKFDEALSPGPSPVVLAGNKDEPWWVAGSTHPGEEEIVLDVYSKIIADDPRWRLMIAPRHIERVPAVMELIIRRGFKAVKLSELDPHGLIPVASGERVKRVEPLNNSGNGSFVIVVDTIGQLRSLYALASLVFVGKSLCVGGGHNIIEPAFYSKAIVIGPKVENFRDIVACFKEACAIVQVQDAHAFETAVRDLCADPSKREALGTAARKVIASNQGAAGRCLERLSGLLK